MKQVQINSLTLQNYRNFSELNLSFDNNIVIIIGENGNGKTNILESVSLLSPGRGLRSAKFDEICQNTTKYWSTDFNLKSKFGLTELKTDFNLADKTRKIYYNGSKIASTELSALLSIVWLTPQMDNLFLNTKTIRRRFLDRIVYNFDTLHASRMNKYDYYVKQRLNHLLSHNYHNIDNSWLNILEEKIAFEAFTIWQKRQEAIDSMQYAIENLDSSFPKARLKLSNLFENETSGESVYRDQSIFIEYYQKFLNNNRKKDMYSKITNFGIHRIDFLVFHSEKNQLAKFCSTGEQKAMIISLTLSQVNMIITKTKAAPILLLDELFVHLDKRRAEYLADYIINSKIQTFITATDINNFKNLALHKNAQIHTI